MRISAAFLVACCLAIPLGGQDGVSAAQALYADARYEDALKAFDALKAAGAQAPRTAIAIEQGRAFCLLALDRKADAQKAIETILGLDPFFKLAEDDAPPKIRTAFRDVTRRTLAGVLLQVYERAKLAYESKSYAEAVSGFGRVLALLDDPDLVLDAGPRADMRLVAKAFEDLAKAASAPPPAVPAAGADAPPAKSPTAGPQQGAQASVLYDAASKNVSAPVPEQTDVRIPDSLKRTRPNGDVVVEVVVSTSGAVESATVRQAPDSVFGALVARAAMTWRYRPALKGGTPVRYRLMVKVVVSSRP
jgi:TonB family protein